MMVDLVVLILIFCTCGTIIAVKALPKYWGHKREKAKNERDFYIRLKNAEELFYFKECKNFCKDCPNKDKLPYISYCDKHYVKEE